MPRWQVEVRRCGPEVTGGFGPREDLRGGGADREGGAAGRGLIAAPVDHSDKATGADGIACGAEERGGFFGVKNIERRTVGQEVGGRSRR